MLTNASCSSTLTLGPRLVPFPLLLLFSLPLLRPPVVSLGVILSAPGIPICNEAGVT